jgi:hypothetical protein
MPGGFIQLQAYGSQNEYINGDPQMSFFKMVYKRHTNFSMEYIRQELEGPNELDINNSIKLQCEVARNADLMQNAVFVFNLPDVYSGYDKSSDTSYKFNWIEDIGNAIIDNVSISIGGAEVDRQYGDWMTIWAELNVAPNMRPAYNELIGNVPELYSPQNIMGNNGVYPTSTLDPEYNKDPEYASISYIDFLNPFTRPASIKGRRVYVPLSFWFCNVHGLSIPLLALQYHHVQFEITLRPVTQLYTLIETRTDDPNYGLRIRPNSAFGDHNISNFITKGATDNLGSKSYEKLGHYSGWNLNPHILINYIFLDEKERKQFAKTSHEYLITQVSRKEHFGVVGNKTLELELQHPCKQIIWVARRNDMSNRNIYNNYTNWEEQHINPHTLAWTSHCTHLHGSTNLDLEVIKAKIPTKDTTKFFEKNIIKNALIKFEGEERISINDHRFYNFLQPYNTAYNAPKFGVYTYSFALDNYKFQPSGSCNMSRIKSVDLEIETQPTPPNVSQNDTLQYKYTYDVIVYIVSYNILRIMSGMAGTVFSN